jgi:hypothetical protein
LPLSTVAQYSDQTTDMSIYPVSRSLLPYLGPVTAANSSATARPVAAVSEAPVTSRDTVTPAANSNPDAGGEADSTLERALRQARVATGDSTSGESNPKNSRFGPAIGLYQRVSQYNDDKPSASALMKSWNDIVRENQFEDAGMADYLKAVAQHNAAAPSSSVLHVTA